MKNFLISLTCLLYSLDMSAQLGYRCEGTFVELTPSTVELFYIQTRNAESKSLLEAASNMEHLQEISKDAAITGVGSPDHFLRTKIWCLKKMLLLYSLDEI